MPPIPPNSLEVYFFTTPTGNEPVREWLKALSIDDRKTIGTDIRTVQIGFPLGMPLVRKLAPNLWEVRSKLTDTIARVLFTIDDNKMILLHGFIKKTQKTPPTDLATANSRLAQYNKENPNDSDK